MKTYRRVRCLVENYELSLKLGHLQNTSVCDKAFQMSPISFHKMKSQEFLKGLVSKANFYS